MSSGTATKLKLDNIVILGANGAMGAGAAALFAGGGCNITLVARDLSKTEAAALTVRGIAKAERVTDNFKSVPYEDMAGAIADADLIFEAVAEDLALKKSLFAKVDAARSEHSVIATVSSGLSIEAMAEGLSDSFRSHFCGIHIFNPPHMMTGTEFIASTTMDADLAASIKDTLRGRFGRAVTTCVDQPAFAGNRVGFKVLNEVAQLAQEHGVQYMDELVGPYTGRAMPPLATVDLVGWDVHQAIVDNVYELTNDEAHESFKLPAYMPGLIAKGHLGNKTPDTGGFMRLTAKGEREQLDTSSGSYRPFDPDLSFDFVNEVRDLNRRGKYVEGMATFMSAEGADADIARKVILGYMSYGLSRVGPGEVVATYDEVDRIMSNGFNWAGPSALADIIGLERAVKELERYSLPVPELLKAAVRGDIPAPLFNLPNITPGRYFGG
jgi:3-hydroxyacyl-CoA dehydrogenase